MKKIVLVCLILTLIVATHATPVLAKTKFEKNCVEAGGKYQPPIDEKNDPNAASCFFYSYLTVESTSGNLVGIEQLGIVRITGESFVSTNLPISCETPSGEPLPPSSTDCIPTDPIPANPIPNLFADKK